MCVIGSVLIRNENNPDGVMSMSMYKKLTNPQNSRRINVITRGCYGNPVRVEFDSLPMKYRRMIEVHYPDPRKAAALAPFAQRIKTDSEAFEIFNTYTYNDNRTLKPEIITSYCNDAAIFNALRIVIDEMTAGRKASGMPTSRRTRDNEKLKSVWEYALECVDGVREIYPCNMPTTEITLKRKYERYINEGYHSLIHAGYGNPNRDKIKDETARAVLITLLSNGAQHDMEQIAKDYNIWAAANKRDTITARTVLNFYTKNEYQIMPYRQGWSKWANKYDKVINRDRPTAPMVMINSDDNDLDLYFKADFMRTQANGKKVRVKTDYYRFKMYVVMDAYSNYILGYAIGDAITNDLIREAYRNAMNHVKELTGSYYLWHQIVADRWGISKDSELRQFFEKQATFTPPTAGLARSKAIEQSFGKQWHAELKYYPNYAGANITAKASHNPDFVDKNRKNYPTIKEGIHQVAQFIERMRTLEWNKSGKSRREVWLEEFFRNEQSRERAVSNEMYLSIFGDKHSAASHTVTNKGITVTIDGNKYTYAVPVELYRQTVGRKVDQIMYDPDDLSRILVVDSGQGIRFVATMDVKMPMALKDMRDGDRERLNEELEIKKMRRLDIISNKQAIDNILERAMIDAQSLLQAGRLEKEARFGATAIAGLTKRQLQEDMAINNVHQLT